MRRTRRWLAALIFAAGACQAQLVPPDPDWKEVDVPAPPPLRTERLIRIDVPESSLRFGVDPDSIKLADDGTVRYVVLATSASGAVNGIYEGVRCGTAEVKVYARHNPSSGWVPAKDSPWRSLHEARQSRHSLAIARNGVCVGAARNRSTQQIVRDLSGDPGWRLWNN